MLYGPPTLHAVESTIQFTWLILFQSCYPCHRRPNKGFAVQLIWCTALDLANSNWQGQRGKGSKALQESIDAALTGSPLMMSSACCSWCL